MKITIAGASMILPETHKLYVASMGRVLRVTALFTSVDEANAHMAKTDDAVVAVFGRPEKGELILLANRYDKGLKVEGRYS